MPRFQQCIHILLLVMALNSIFVSCRNNDIPPYSNGICFYTRGQATINNQGFSVSRKVLSDGDGQRMCIESTYRLAAAMPLRYTSSDWIIKEYITRDSLFIFDLADRTLLALSRSDADYLGPDALPYSAAWLFPDKQIEATNGLLHNETRKIAGMPCRISESGNRTTWLYGHQPLACQFVSTSNCCTEITVRYVPDTLLADTCFRRPAGFQRLRPLNQ